MRILLVSELYWPYIGGAEVLGVRLVRALRERGHQAVVVTSHNQVDLPDRDEYEGTPIHRLGVRMALAARDLDALAAARETAATLRRDYAPDVVHVNGLGTLSGFLGQLEDSDSAATLLTLHNDLLPGARDVEHSLTGRLLRRADWVTAVSRHALEDAASVAPEIRSRSSVILNGIDAPAEPPAPLPRNPPVVLCLGRLISDKGFDLALRAFAELRRVGLDCRLVVAGEGRERHALEDLAAALGLKDSVHFAGWIDPVAVPSFLNRATCVLLPSRREGLPLVAIESAAMARPIVCTRIGGLPEVVDDGKTGRVVEPEDTAALAAALAEILNDVDRAQAWGRAGRERALDRFSWRKCVDAYEMLYARLVRR